MHKNIIIITFDIYRPDYPTTSYSIASILASLKHYNISASHHSINIKQYLGASDKDITTAIKEELQGSIAYFKKFDYLAISVTRWSIDHANTIIEMLGDYSGKIILGGYEITAIKEDDLLYEFPAVDYFVKGYAEKTLVKLIQGKYAITKKVLQEDLDDAYLISPYSTGVLNTYARKAYWETKRGCRFKCGFCEWGNAQPGSISLRPDDIDTDIELFSHSNVDEINILDGTFNVQNDYLAILKKLVKKTNATITFQARFEALKPDFIQFCAEHTERLHLEFGLQTIHKKEMEVIGRPNNMELIAAKLQLLNHHNIDYEVSIIYAIPGQTVQSFIDTIEFLRVHNCKKIMAFPLQIPRNSELETKSEEYQIEFVKDKYNVQSVGASYSFDRAARADMDRIAQSLADENSIVGLTPDNNVKIQNATYQYKINPEFIADNIKLFKEIIHKEFCHPTMNEINFEYSFFDGMLVLGQLSSLDDNDYINYATGGQSIDFNKLNPDASFKGLDGKSIPYNRKDNLYPIRFFCDLVVGESGNVYIYRKVEVNKEEVWV